MFNIPIREETLLVGVLLKWQLGGPSIKISMKTAFAFQDGTHYLYDTVLKRKSNSSLIRTVPGRMVKIFCCLVMACKTQVYQFKSYTLTMSHSIVPRSSAQMCGSAELTWQFVLIPHQTAETGVL